MTRGAETLTVLSPSHIRDLLAQSPQAIRELLVEVTGLAGAADLISRAETAAVSWRAASRAEIVKLGGRDARGVLALMYPFEYSALEILVGSGNERRCLLALDSAQDPGNLAAVIRNAAFFGATGIILPEDRSVQVTATVARRSAGALWMVKIARVKNLVRTLEQLKSCGFWMYATVVKGGKAPRNEVFPEKSCFVLGGEGKGLRRLVRDRCDVRLTVPGKFESLNLGAFSAVLLYEWAVQGGEVFA